jgi:hypothetical protein
MIDVTVCCADQLGVNDNKNGYDYVNTQMINNVTKAAQGYLNAVRQLRWFNFNDDMDNLLEIVPSLADAGCSRAEILEVLGHMGQEGGEWVDEMLDSIAYAHPWMNWGTKLN